MKIPPQIKPWIKIFALAIGVIADGIMLFACFTSQAPDMLGKFAFGTLGITIILLIPLTYEERAFKLWACLVIVAVFFDTSYLLATTKPVDPKDIVTVENDQELARLAGLAKTAQDTLNLKLAEYDKAMKVDTRLQLDGQITDSRRDAESKELDRKNRFEAIERGEITKRQLTADDIFKAIPEAFTGRFFHLIMYFLLAVIIQGMIVFSLSDGVSKKGYIAQIGDRLLGKKQPERAPVVRAVKKPKRKRSPPKKPQAQERFDDVTDSEYRAAAEQGDGSVKLPEVVAVELGITRDEAERKHGELYQGYGFLEDRYVRIDNA